MRNLSGFLSSLCCCVFVAACASTPPINMAGTDPGLTPTQALAETARGRRVAWGGTIVNVTNLKDTTEVELLSYALDSGGRPDTGAATQQRFLLVRKGYLETADYRAGRLVSAVGTVSGTRQGKVGEAPYTYPVLQAEQIYLWPIDESRPVQTNVHFGIGIGISR